MEGNKVMKKSYIYMIVFALFIIAICEIIGKQTNKTS